MAELQPPGWTCAAAGHATCLELLRLAATPAIGDRPHTSWRESVGSWLQACASAREERNLQEADSKRADCTVAYSSCHRR